MLASLLLMATAVAAPVNDGAQVTSANPDQFVGRKEATISFTSQINNFQVKREKNEDILYLNTDFGHWYRAPMNCFGMGDPQSAMGVVPLSRGYPIDKFTRFKLVSMAQFDNNTCYISSLIELTPQETVQLGLETQKAVDARAERAAKNQK